MQKENPDIATRGLLVLLSLAAPLPDEIERMHSLAPFVLDWDYFYNLSVFNKVSPICCYNIKKLKLAIPDTIVSKLGEQAQKIKEKNTRRNSEAVKFLEKFSENGIQVALLKGVAFGETVYQNPAYKRMNDIDLLVHKSDINAIYKIYDDLDYFYVGERISGNREKSDKISHLAPHFVSRDFSCIIGTQWGIKSPLSGYRIDYDGIWSRTVPLNFNGVELCMLSPEDNLLHLCLHLGRFKTSLRDMMDFYNLIRFHGDKFDWHLFYELTISSKSANPVFFALGISNFLVPIPEVNALLEKIEPLVSHKYKMAVALRTQSLGIFLDSYSDHIQSIEKVISSFDNTEWLPEKWNYFKQIWGMIFWPQKEEFLRMNSLESPSRIQNIKARLGMPFLIIDVIAGEIGRTIVVLLMGKTIFDLTKTIFKFPYVKKENVNSEAYARRMGIDSESIKKLMQQVQ